MSDKVFWRCILSGAAGGFVFFALIVALAFGTGATFGQRCDRLYPNNARAIEDCVDRLSKGERP